jgi:hypothetical protein
MKNTSSKSESAIPKLISEFKMSKGINVLLVNYIHYINVVAINKRTHQPINPSTHQLIYETPAKHTYC